MYCRNCGNELNDTAQICVKCGVQKPKGYKYCPGCGKETDPQAAVCLECGIKLYPQPASAANRAVTKTYCRNCGKEIDQLASVCVSCGHKKGSGNAYCPRCGNPTEAGAAVCTSCGSSISSSVYAGGNGRNRLAAGLMGILLGYLGVHNFYLGKTAVGVVQLLMTVLGFILVFPPMISAAWGIIEGIMILAGSINTDADGNPLV